MSFIRLASLVFVFFALLRQSVISLEATAHQDSSPIEIHNHILWSHRNSVVTLLDVVHKLDNYLDPKIASSMSAQDKYEYYQQNWRSALQDLIDNELVYQDAIDHGMQISDAEAKDELVRQYGDHYLSALDAKNISLPEAIAQTKKELLIQRMFYFRVQYHSRNEITPRMVAQAYEEYLKQNPETDIWLYRFVTIRGPQVQAKQLAEKLAADLQSKIALEQAVLLAKEACETQFSSNSNLTKVNVSNLLEQSSQELNTRYLEILQSMKPEQISSAIDFSRQDSQEGIFRIFILEEIRHQKAQSFAQMNRILEEQLRRKLIETESHKYLSHLRKQHEREQGESLNAVFNPPFTLFTLR